MNRFLTQIAATALLAASFPAAAETLYRVEIILFANLDNRAFYEEVWNRPAPPATARAVDLDHPPPGFTTPGPESRNLAGISSRLARGDGYRLLAHRSWIQPGLAERSARPVRITAEGVDGTVTLILGRYLHLQTDLVYETTMDGRTITVPVNDRRRMRSNELHYIDHPLLGVIVEVTPVVVTRGDNGATGDEIVESEAAVDGGE